MMFKGAYKSEFYRALHDAMHAEVESWSPPWRFSVTDFTKSAAPLHELWEQVYRLEETCRNPDATEIPQWICS